ncbi:MAG: ABC transporter ATP-binding protein, partial [Planctomycetota bacterium]
MNQQGIHEDVRVEFRGVTKVFRRGEDHGSLRDALPALARRVTGRGPRRSKNEFLSLDDVSFEVRSGECLGIIGPNGAGKSTLLKCASKILRPNAGTVVVRGRVSALIEVGAGFHPDLTGRENIFLYGAVLGMRRREVKERFDRIVDFSGIGPAIDTPAKRYSSGMFARLGFAVAALMDPDVLLIDEVLSVGDRQFSDKCEYKIREILAGGAAVLFVSHNLAAVRMICDRVALLERGRLTFVGSPDDAIRRYHQAFRHQQDSQLHSRSACQCDARILGAFQREVETLQPGQPFHVEISMKAREPIED